MLSSKIKTLSWGVIGIIVLPSIIFSFQNCAQTKFSAIEQPSVSGLNYCDQSPNDPVCSRPIELKCEFDGQTYAEGQIITAYQSSSVGFSEVCQSEQRVCQNGSFSGSLQYSKCTVDAPLDCQFNGQQVSHGSSVKSFLNSTESFGTDCQSQDRLCTNGVLSGRYNYASCKEDAPADCLFNGVQIKHGDPVVGYRYSSVPFGGTCDAQTRQCFNGALTGQFEYASCAPAVPSVCRFNGRDVVHGDKVPAFESSTVPFGSLCKQEDRTCNNGVLNGTFLNAACEPGLPKACSLNGQQINHDERISAFQQSTVPVGTQCVSEFRTCSNGTLNGTYSNLSCVVDTTQEKILSVQETNIYAPFKLLLIVDDSYTMTKSQTQISNNLDSLLLPLKGQNVDVRIITTSDYNDYGTQITNYIKADGTTVPGQFVNSTNSLYRDSAYVKVDVFSPLIPRANNWGVSFLSTDSASVVQTKINALKQNIIQVGTSGLDNEKVLCPLLRELKNTQASAFFKPNDKAAIVVLSDENDGSTSAECISQNQTQYGPLNVRTTTTLPSNYYRFSVKQVSVSFTATRTWTTAAVIRDGIIVTPAKQGVDPYSSSTSMNQISAADAATLTTCRPVAESILNSWGYNSSNGYSNLTVTSCTVTTGTQSHNDNKDVTKDLCDQNQKSSILGGKSLSEYWPDYAGNCSSTPYPGGTSTTYNRYTIQSTISSYFSDLNANSTNLAFDQVVYDSLESAFGNNYFMSFIINKSGQSCALKTGQSFGTRYESFAFKNNNKIKTFSICDTSYTPALAQVSDFISRVATTKYNLGLPTSSRLIDVFLNDVKLDPTKYSFSNGVLELKVSLTKDDKIKIVYAPR